MCVFNYRHNIKKIAWTKLPYMSVYILIIHEINKIYNTVSCYDEHVVYLTEAVRCEF